MVVRPGCLAERHSGVNDDKRASRELALRQDRYVAGNLHALAVGRRETARGVASAFKIKATPSLDRTAAEKAPRYSP